MTIEVALIYIAAAIMLAIGALAAGLGIGMLSAHTMDGMARQPGVINELMTKYFMMVGLVDAFPVISLAMGLYLMFAVAGNAPPPPEVPPAQKNVLTFPQP